MLVAPSRFGRSLRIAGSLSLAFATLVASSALAPAPAGAQARSQSFGIDISGGLAAPTGDLGNFVNSGYNVAVGLRISQPASPLGFRLEGMFSQFDYSDNSGTTHRLVSATANGTYNMQGNGIGGLYLIGGVGIYGASDDGGFYYGQGNSSSTVTNAGLNGGAGYRLPLSGFSMFLEARYHYVFGTPQDSFIPITVGISF